MTAEELRQLIARAGSLRGWDWSRLRMERDPVPWAYPEIVQRYRAPESHVLDVGTGGGKVFQRSDGDQRTALAPVLRSKAWRRFPRTAGAWAGTIAPGAGCAVVAHGEYDVSLPPAVDDGDPRAGRNRCESYLDLGLFVRPPIGLPPRVGQPPPRFPCENPADFEAVAGGLIIDLDEPAADVGLEPQPPRPGPIVPVVRPAPPPPVDACGEQLKCTLRVEGDLDGARGPLACQGAGPGLGLLPVHHDVDDLAVGSRRKKRRTPILRTP